MAKKGPRVTIKLVSKDGMSVYYTEKNTRNSTEKLVRNKYNPYTRQHEAHSEGKMK